MNPKQLFEHLIGKHHLSAAQMQDVISQCMTGTLTDIQIATFLALMRMKGETITELTAAAQMMREFAKPINLGQDLIDIVGTGGDGLNTFNISTACSFVVAAAGFPVAKHGNRAVSSSSGSSDLLEKAGFVLTLTEKQTKTCMHKHQLAFLFAPHYHPALLYARTARQQLGIRTLFNLLGPLLNPARATKQVVGVFSKQWLEPVANVLSNLGSQRALVLHSQDGLDEISIAAPTDILEYKKNSFRAWQLNPQDYGLNHHSLHGIVVHSPQQSLDLILQVFSGEKGPARDMVLLNSAAAIYCAQEQADFNLALEKAKEAIDSTKAFKLFEQLKTLTQNLDKEANHE